MKEEIKNINPDIIGRGLFRVSLGAYIFTSLFYITLFGTNIYGQDMTASTYYLNLSNNIIRAEYAEAAAAIEASGKPNVSIKASTKFVNYGENIKLSWTSSGVSSCSLFDGSKKVISTAQNANEFKTDPIYKNTSFYVVCKNTAGVSASSAAIITLLSPITDVTSNVSSEIPVDSMISIKTIPSSIVYGGEVKVLWRQSPSMYGCLITRSDIENGQTLFAKPEFSMVEGVPSGVIRSQTFFEIKCKNKYDKLDYVSTATVDVIEPSIMATNTPNIIDGKINQINNQKSTSSKVSFYADPRTIEAGKTTRLFWTTTGVSLCDINYMTEVSTGTKKFQLLVSAANSPTSGYETPVLNKNTLFKISCMSNSGKVLNAEVPVKVSMSSRPQVTLNINKDEVPVGGQVEIVWVSRNATSCKLMRNTTLLSNDLSGNIKENVKENSTYWITCMNASSAISESSVVMIK